MWICFFLIEEWMLYVVLESFEHFCSLFNIFQMKKYLQLNLAQIDDNIKFSINASTRQDTIASSQSSILFLIVSITFDKSRRVICQNYILVLGFKRSLFSSRSRRISLSLNWFSSYDWCFSTSYWKSPFRYKSTSLEK